MARGITMRGPAKERWKQLCAEAAVEQDANKLLALVKEIDELPEENERRLGIPPPKTESGRIIGINMESRYLHFGNLTAQGEPIHAQCSCCNRDFVGIYGSANERTDEVLLRIRAEFEAHECG